jgi:DNA-binding CsgD family transcriptional regulator
MTAIPVMPKPVVDRPVDTQRPVLAEVGVATLDPRLRLLEANDEFLGGLRRAAAEVYGQHFGDLLHPSVKQAVLQQLGRLAEGRRRRFEARFIDARVGTTRFSGGVTGVATRDDSGRTSSIVLLVRPDRQTDGAPPGAERKKLLSVLDAQVLEGVAAGSSTVQLARKLYLSKQGVEYHVAAMLRRFKCPNRSALVAKAYTRGVLAGGLWPPKVVGDFVR